MRAAAINLRALPEERELIDRAARVQGRTRSDFMLEAACEKARHVLLDQVFFELDDDRLHEFHALLDSPASDDPGLRRLLAVQAPWA